MVQYQQLRPKNSTVGGNPEPQFYPNFHLKKKKSIFFILHLQLKQTTQILYLHTCDAFEPKFAYIFIVNLHQIFKVRYSYLFKLCEIVFYKLKMFVSNRYEAIKFFVFSLIFMLIFFFFLQTEVFLKFSHTIWLSLRKNLS